MKKKEVKNKKSLHRHLTRVLHPNRHFIWAILFSSIASAVLLAYIIISSINFDTSNNIYLYQVDIQVKY